MYIVQKQVRLGSCIASSFPKAMQVCVGEDLAFVIVDLTFHRPLHICKVRRQPSRSGSFAWLGSHPGLATLTSLQQKAAA